MIGAAGTLTSQPLCIAGLVVFAVGCSLMTSMRTTDSKRRRKLYSASPSPPSPAPDGGVADADSAILLVRKRPAVSTALLPFFFTTRLTAISR